MTTPSTKASVSLIVVIGAGAIALLRWKSGFEPHTFPNQGVESLKQGAAPSTNAVISTFGRLQNSPRAVDSKRELAELHKILHAMPSDVATEWIRSFLASGKDAITGLSFEPGNDGNLTEWPTFRTFLLDSLSSIDPAAAANISRDLLKSPTTADEWALALRNTGRFDTSPESLAFLRSKTEELITHPEWQQAPTAGYLNAFDVLVFTEAVESTPLLSELIQRKDRKDLAHAGFLTLDRLVQRKPVEVLQRLATDSSLRDSRPEMVAQEIARADLRAPAERAIVKSWLLDPSRTQAELQAFTSVYPNSNRFVSNNLLSKDSQPTGSEIAAHDRAALLTIRAWLTNPDFIPVKSDLRVIERRLESFTGGQ